MTTSTQQSAIGATRFRRIEPNGTYSGLTALTLPCGREWVTMSYGDAADAALLAKLDEIPATEVRQ